MLPCKDCGYCESIPGDSHFQCVFNWDAMPDLKIPRRTGSERTAQWFIFPFNFDPTWGPEECEAFSETRLEELVKKPSSLAALLAMLK